MATKKICVLGAAGSIGSRLVSQLVSDGVDVTAVVRSLSSAVRIGRYPLNLVTLDLGSISENELCEVLAGHDVVIDCTYSTDPDYDKCLSDAEQLARLICGAAVKSGVSRLIHYGTISVYPTDVDSVDESVQCSLKGDRYGDSKLVAEDVFLSYSSDDLAVTVLQLPIVFGPYMGWTTSVVSLMTGNSLVISNHFDGACSPLFIDDVVRITKFAFECEQSYGHRVLLSDDPMPWGAYMSSYADLSESLVLTLISRKAFQTRQAQHEFSSRPFQVLKSAFSNDGDFRQMILSQFGIRSIYGLAKRVRGQEGMDEIKYKIQSSLTTNEEVGEVLLEPHLFNLFDSLPRVNSTKARTLFGDVYTPFSEAMSQTQGWLRWARLID